MATYPSTYYDRFDRSKNYDKHLFLAGRVLQSAELNEVQSGLQDRIQRVADVLFKDGDIINGAQIVVDAATGACTCQSGAVYIRGAVRGVPTGSLTIATTGVVQVGVYLVENVVTELEDPALRDPAVGVRNYQEPGAQRLQIVPTWGFAGDGNLGEFYPVWTVEDGNVLSKEPPPNIDAVSAAIAAYDRQSTGGSYIVSGLRVSVQADLGTGEQVYSVQEGEARVNGKAVALGTALREVYASTPDLRRITSEPHLSSTASAQRINVDRTPIDSIISAQITAEKTVTVTHGAFTGAMDTLPDTSILSIESVSQGATTYVQGTDYKLTAGQVDWSLAGDEPAPGSTYSVTYRYITSVTPTAVDETGFTVTGAISGTLVQVTYDAALPRYDRLCLTPDGTLQWIKGISADYYPVAPDVPDSLLLLATVYQTWFDGVTRSIRNDGVRAVPMSEIEDIRDSVLDLYDLVSQQRLQIDASSRSAAATKGLFVDPFRNNNQRDAGQTQNAVTQRGLLTIPISESVAAMPATGGKPVTLTFNHGFELQQTLRTTTMKVNPYMSFDPLPAAVTLSPAVDNFVTNTTQWAQSLFLGSGNTQSLLRNEQIGSAVIAEYNLRQINVTFSLSGFGPGENLNQVIFDGVDVTASVVGV